MPFVTFDCMDATPGRLRWAAGYAVMLLVVLAATYAAIALAERLLP